MLAALKYKDKILSEFYLDKDNLTIKRSKDDLVKGKFKKDAIAVPFSLKGNNGYDYRGIHVPGGKTSLSLPWMLIILRNVHFDDNSVIDHINGDITDNSVENLRITTQEMNCKNRSKRSDNTTGFTGLTYHKGSGRYVVRRTINGKRIWKSHKTLEGAIEILREVEKLGLKDGYTKRHGL